MNVRESFGPGNRLEKCISIKREDSVFDPLEGVCSILDFYHAEIVIKTNHYRPASDILSLFLSWN